MSGTTDFHHATSDDWKDGTGWSIGLAPGSVYPYPADADFVSGGTYTVTVTDVERAGGVLLAAPTATLAIATGGMLLLGNGIVAPNLTISAGTLDLAGTLGTGTGQALTIVEGGATVYDGGVLSNVHIQGTLDLSAANAVLISTSGLSVSNTSGGTGEIDVTGSGASLTFASTTTLSNVNLFVGGVTSASVTVAKGATLTLDSQSTLQVANVDSGSNPRATTAVIGGAGKLVLQGNTNLEAYSIYGGKVTPYQTLDLATAGVENDGTITVGGGYTGGMLVISGALTGTGTVLVGNAAVYVQGSNSTDNVVVVDLKSTVASTQTIEFDNSSLTVLRLEAVGSSSPTAVAAKITGLSESFADKPSIDLPNVAYSTSLIGSVGSGGLLTIKNGSVVEALLNTDMAVNQTVYLSSDGTGGTTVVACYLSGTRILTAMGEASVEGLTIGDTVVTASGQHRLIRWIGRRSYAGRFLAANPGVQPIRFRAGSLGNGLPQRDLLVSPEHAMLLDGVLIPARCLVNGSTIAQECTLAQVDYFHIEMDSHDVLLAEGAPSESYLDDDSRSMFHNAVEFASLYPDAPSPGRFCAPRVEDGPALEAVRQRLRAVAGERIAA